MRKIIVHLLDSSTYHLVQLGHEDDCVFCWAAALLVKFQEPGEYAYVCVGTDDDHVHEVSTYIGEKGLTVKCRCVATAEARELISLSDTPQVFNQHLN